MKLKFLLLKDSYIIYKLKNNTGIPPAVFLSDFYSVTGTAKELSVVSKIKINPEDTLESNKDWRILTVAGPLDLSLTGIIAEISGLLREKNIPIFTISTYETDHILVKSSDLKKTVEALKLTGHEVIAEK